MLKFNQSGTVLDLGKIAVGQFFAAMKKILVTFIA
jgi:hypothetical protein